MSTMDLRGVNPAPVTAFKPNGDLDLRPTPVWPAGWPRSKASRAWSFSAMPAKEPS